MPLVVSAVLAAGLVVIQPVLLGSVLPGLRASPVPLRWWAGTCVALWWLAAARAFGIPWAVSVPLLGAGSAAAGLRWWWSRDVLPVPGPSPSRGERLALVLLLLPLLATAAVHVLFLTLPDHDGTWIWLAKANVIRADLGVREHAAYIAHAGYPAGGPLAWAWTWTLSGSDDEALGRLFPLVAFGVTSVLLATLVRGAGPLAVVAGPMAAAWSVFRVQWTEGAQDGLLTLLVVAALVAALREADGGDGKGRVPAWTVGLLAGSAGLVKHEGNVLGVLVFVAWLVDRRGRDVPRSLQAAGVLAACVVLRPVLSYIEGVDVTTVQGNAFSVASVLSAPLRAPERLARIGEHFLAFHGNNRLLVAVAVVVGAATWVRRARWSHATAPLLAFVVLHAAFVTWVFLATREDFEWHLSTAFTRLCAQGLAAPIVLWSLVAGGLVARRHGPPSAGA